MVGLLLGISLMVLRYNLALKQEEVFNRLYIQVTDERNRMIDEKTRTLLFDILLLLAAGLSLHNMIFPIILNLNQFLTLTIIHGFWDFTISVFSYPSAIKQKSWQSQLPH